MGCFQSFRIGYAIAILLIFSYLYVFVAYVGIKYYHIGHQKQSYSDGGLAVSKIVQVPISFLSDTGKPDWYIHSGFPLAGYLKSPQPAFTMGNVSGDTDFMIGIPTVKRDRADYLIDTIKSLIKNRRFKNATFHRLDLKEGAFRIVVFIGDSNQEYVQKRSQQLLKEFSDEFDSGRLQVISPPKHYYPDWSTAITTTLNDPIDRVKWRSKENLDVIFLMMYIYQLSPKYYLMLEDDVLCNEGYDRTIVENTELMKDNDWLFLSYCDWCSIGKLLKTEIIPSFASFLHMYWNKKPLDWLQLSYIRAGYCREDEPEENCQFELAKMMHVITPYVFTHVGRKRAEYLFQRRTKTSDLALVFTVGHNYKLEVRFDIPMRKSGQTGRQCLLRKYFAQANFLLWSRR